MKTIPNFSGRSDKATSYRINIGCDRALQSGLIAENGDGRRIIPVKLQSGLLLIPVDQPIESLSYKGFTTDVFEHNGVYCGEITNYRSAPTWFCKDKEKIASSFHTIVDKLADKSAD